MKMAKYEVNGGPIIVEIGAKHATIGLSYELRLFSPDMKKYFPFAQGNSKDTIEDRHKLPGQNSDHAGRVIEGFGVVGPFSQGDPYRVDMTIYQNGKEIGKDKSEGVAQGIVSDFKIQIRLQEEK